MLIRLLYASTAQGVDLNEFKRILSQAQTNNDQRDLTGMLAFNSKLFLQALEGARDQVNELYAKLMRDPRHHTVTILSCKEIEERHWASWSMGFAAPNADNRALFLKYSQQSTFNPYAMKADAARENADGADEHHARAEHVGTGRCADVSRWRAGASDGPWRDFWAFP